MLVCLTVAGAATRFNVAVVLLVIADYFGTAALRDMIAPDINLLAVGFLDALCAFAIIAMRLGDRANIIAALFLGMLPIYAIGWLFEWSDYATFTVVEPLGWLQIMVVGNVDRGLGRFLGRMARRVHGQRALRDISGRPVGSISARNAASDLGIHQADDR